MREFRACESFEARRMVEDGVRFRPLAHLAASVGAIAIAVLATALANPSEDEFGSRPSDADAAKPEGDEPTPEPADFVLVDGREAAQGETREAARELIVRFFVEHLQRGRRRGWRRPAAVWPPDLAGVDAAILACELKHTTRAGAATASLEAFAEEKCRTVDCYRSAYLESCVPTVSLAHGSRSHAPSSLAGSRQRSGKSTTRRR